MSSSAQLFQGGQVGFRFLKIDALAEHLGIGEPPLRFMIGILLGFPFSLIFLLLPKNNSTVRHLYFAICGMLISYFCFGSESAFNLISLLVTYISLILFGGTKANVIFNFIFQTGYLFGAYILFSSDGYDIKWTTPQCIMCLRLIGLAWDCYDGRQDKEKLRPDLRNTCYEGTPTFIEILGYSYFFGGFMAGPQFSFQRYIKFAENRLVDEEGQKCNNSRFFAAFKRTLGGTIALIVFVLYDPVYHFDFTLGEEFAAKSFFAKSTQITLSYHIHFCKYVMIWLYAESCCIITGLAYNGVKDGKSKWDGVRNFKFRKVMLGPFYQDMLEGFNINTSQWAGRYLFKRLAFLGNKTASHVLTLFYLSLWHGFYVGYFILFSLEFTMLLSERQFCAALKNIVNISYSELPLYIRLPIRVLNATLRAYSCAFATVAFVLLRWRRIKIVYAELYYWLCWFSVAWISVIILLKAFGPKRMKEDAKKRE